MAKRLLGGLNIFTQISSCHCQIDIKEHINEMALINDLESFVGKPLVHNRAVKQSGQVPVAFGLQGFWYSPIKPWLWLKKEQSLARNEKSGCHLCGLQD
jgi:hypothetical protein